MESFDFSPIFNLDFNRTIVECRCRQNKKLDRSTIKF